MLMYARCLDTLEQSQRKASTRRIVRAHRKLQMRRARARIRQCSTAPVYALQSRSPIEDERSASLRSQTLHVSVSVLLVARAGCGARTGASEVEQRADLASARREAGIEVCQSSAQTEANRAKELTSVCSNCVDLREGGQQGWRSDSAMRTMMATSACANQIRQR